MATKVKRGSTALVVSEDPGLVEGLTRWLETDGIDVIACPGPRAPQFSCMGLRGIPCPLVGAADIVLLDLHPEPGQLVDRTRRTELISYYRQRGQTVLAIVEAAGLVEFPGGDGVAIVDRLAERGELLGAVRDLLGVGILGVASGL